MLIQAKLASSSYNSHCINERPCYPFYKAISRITPIAFPFLPIPPYPSNNLCCHYLIVLGFSQEQERNTTGHHFAPSRSFVRSGALNPLYSTTRFRHTSCHATRFVPVCAHSSSRGNPRAASSHLEPTAHIPVCSCCYTPDLHLVFLAVSHKAQLQRGRKKKQKSSISSWASARSLSPSWSSLC